MITIKSVLKRMAVKLSLPRKYIWRFGAQRSEYQFHARNQWRTTDDFMNQTRALFTFWGYSSSDFAGEIIVDLGAGSKLRSKFFEQARIAAIEPLADRFMQSIDWCDLKDAWRVFSYPAETPIPELDGQVRFVMCLNVLDHVYEYQTVLKNVHTMLQPGGEFLLSVDLHDDVSIHHPVPLTKQTLLPSIQALGFNVLREYDRLEPISKPSYGEGVTYTLILRK